MGRLRKCTLHLADGENSLHRLCPQQVCFLSSKSVSQGPWLDRLSEAEARTGGRLRSCLINKPSGCLVVPPRVHPPALWAHLLLHYPRERLSPHPNDGRKLTHQPDPSTPARYLEGFSIFFIFPGCLLLWFSAASSHSSSCFPSSAVSAIFSCHLIPPGAPALPFILTK